MNAKLAGILLVCSCYLPGAIITPDLSAVKTGPIAVSSSEHSLEVRWKDGAARQWEAMFSLDSSKPLITAITVDGTKVVERADPVYRCSTGKRRGGWDAFFDFPPNHPDGTRSFFQEFHPSAAVARTVGDRVEISFDGMRLGIFSGSLRYVFYPGSSLIQQVAVVSTNEPDTAYYYDAGLQMAADKDRQPGGNMASSIAYFDANGKPQTIVPPYGSERHPLAVRYRAVAARTAGGSIAAFPSPHRYFFARDYTTNLGYVWYTSWRGHVGLGIRQLPDDNSPYYPWMNAPPGTEQEMGLFLLLGAGGASDTLKQVLAYTHSDRFPHLNGFVTYAPHWHLAYTEQAMAKGLDWQPPFKAAMEAMGLDAAMIMDFHGDGHPRDLTGIRLHELDEYYRACRAQSGKNFLLIPAEEANVILGGHWGVVFPKPVYWYMDRKPDQPFQSRDEKYGTVYRVHTPADVWKMVTQEGGYVYQTHPRTKGSTGYPDKIRDTDYFRDARFLGTGWKAMPSDLSSPRLGERAFKILDDMNNWGMHKRTIGEVDVFQLGPTHELYAHMNVNYLRLPELPDFDHYNRLLDAVAKGDGFISTGEIVLPAASITAASGDSIHVETEVRYTFPLRLAEIVWGDGTDTHRQLIDLQSTHEFGHGEFKWDINAPRWTWARLALWDVAGDGAFTNPVWRAATTQALANKNILLDAYHNQEPKQPDHYRWEGTQNGGFSELGGLLRGLGAKLKTTFGEITPSSLAGVDCLIIVDPDTATESDHPHYISPSEIEAIVSWVAKGGRLVLLGNNEGNAEFEHLNRLAGRFGFTFEEATVGKTQGKAILTLTGQGTIFDGAPVFYAVDVAPIKVEDRAVKTLLDYKGVPVMVLAHAGKGSVFGLGDPWIYNEYIHRHDNVAIATKLFTTLFR